MNLCLGNVYLEGKMINLDWNLYIPYINQTLTFIAPAIN